MWSPSTIWTGLRNLKWFRLALGVLIFLSAQTVLRAATFTAALDKSTLMLGETATLSLTFEGGSPKEVPALPEIPNLQVVYLGPSSQTTIINGVVSSTTILNFT